LVFHEEGLGDINPDDVVLDSMLNGGDGYIYIGTTGGALLRLNRKTVTLEYLGHPSPDTRVNCLKVGENGLIYGGYGMGKAGSFVYDRESRRFTDLGLLYDPYLDVICYRPPREDPPPSGGGMKAAA